ncbi:hypothetical protein N0V85_007312 [Neurospora sp. IMI 360204]|nr:hypothetical protein N0V85_007312 [Neurospora sp. IMI 360204]
MPDKTLTVAAYAAGASLAAITLIYVFGPTYFLDNDPSANSTGVFSTKKNGAVGLVNPANDCFINSVLQALAGLGDLRLYLIRETHRRSLDGGWVYAQTIPSDVWDSGGDGDETSKWRVRGGVPEWKAEGLQMGIVTKGLKDILDALNERPIYKKTISAAPFVKTLEIAFGQRISRQQQDAQEFLQVVAERLCDEYHAGQRARSYAMRAAKQPTAKISFDSKTSDNAVLDLPLPRVASGQANCADQPAKTAASAVPDGADEERAEGFPFEGSFESQIECLTCGLRPRPTQSTFCTLTLNVPHVQATTLNACFDGMFETEYIEDFKCEKCRLLHAKAVLEADIQRSTSESSREKARTALASLELAIETDPEKTPEGVELPDPRYAPKRKIARHIRMTGFPRILAIHLSRSIYDMSNFSQKNLAKIAFPELLPLGGLLQQRKYKLLGVVTHKGNHHSGHYESFRRQNIYPPFSNPSTFQPSGAYINTSSPSNINQAQATQPGSGQAPTPGVDGGITPTNEARSTSTSRERDTDTNSLRSAAASARSTLIRIASKPSSRAGSPDTTGSKPNDKIPNTTMKSKRQKSSSRWWRISDDKVKEASTRDVLGMQREVYLLFYELERENP